MVKIDNKKEAEKLYKQITKKEKLSLKDKFKAKLLVGKIIAKNSRLLYTTNRLMAKAKKCESCKVCSKKVKELAKTKYSDKKAYEMILNNYFCEKCTPLMRDYYERMLNIKPGDIKS